MTETLEAAPEAAAPGLGAVVANLLFSPREAFSHIVRRPGIWLPLGLNVLLSVAFMVAWTSHMDVGEFMKNQMIESGQWDKMTPEQRAGSARAAPFVRASMWVAGAVVPPLFLVATAGALLFVFRFFYASEVNFKQSLAITSWSMFVQGAVVSVLRLTVMGLKGEWNLPPNEVLRANLTLLLEKSSTPVALWTFLSFLDLFLLWLLWLLASGFGEASRRRTLAAFWGILVPYLLLIAAPASLLAWMFGGAR